MLMRSLVFFIVLTSSVFASTRERLQSAIDSEFTVAPDCEALLTEEPYLALRAERTHESSSVTKAYLEKHEFFKELLTLSGGDPQFAKLRLAIAEFLYFHIDHFAEANDREQYLKILKGEFNPFKDSLSAEELHWVKLHSPAFRSIMMGDYEGAPQISAYEMILIEIESQEIANSSLISVDRLLVDQKRVRPAVHQKKATLKANEKFEFLGIQVYLEKLKRLPSDARYRFVTDSFKSLPILRLDQVLKILEQIPAEKQYEAWHKLRYLIFTPGQYFILNSNSNFLIRSFYKFFESQKEVKSNQMVQFIYDLSSYSHAIEFRLIKPTSVEENELEKPKSIFKKLREKINSRIGKIVSLSAAVVGLSAATAYLAADADVLTLSAPVVDRVYINPVDQDVLYLSKIPEGELRIATAIELLTDIKLDSLSIKKFEQILELQPSNVYYPDLTVESGIDEYYDLIQKMTGKSWKRDPVGSQEYVLFKLIQKLDTNGMSVEQINDVVILVSNKIKATLILNSKKIEYTASVLETFRKILLQNSQKDPQPKKSQLKNKN